MEQEHILQSELEEYCKKGFYPMHMPGHKRNLPPAPGLPYEWDLTEAPGVDDLHHARGILKEAMQRTAELWGSRRTWYLVNGSTCGILASIYAAVPTGGEIIAARNCHKSVFHAIELLNLRPHFLMPEYVSDWGIFGSVDLEEVRQMLKRSPDTKAVIVTSPTYEGIVSDIKSIALICHEAHVPLIVDEAHGAHFGLFSGKGTFSEKKKSDRFDSQSAAKGKQNTVEHENIATVQKEVIRQGIFSDSALHLGADLVIQSAHKTLPSLTQTAFLHMGKDSIITEEAIEHGLDIFETSSPSYPLMASLDGCTGILKTRGKELFTAWQEEISKTEKVCAELQAIEVFQHDPDKTDGIDTDAGHSDAAPGKYGKFSAEGSSIDGIRSHAMADKNSIGSVWSYDDSRFLLRAKKEYGVTGEQLADLFRDECEIESEMHCGRNVLMMTGCGDTEEGFDRFRKALLHVDRIVEDRHSSFQLCCEEEKDTESTGKEARSCPIQVPDMVCPIAKAVRKVREGNLSRIPLKEAAGKISGEYVMAYPPGIPVLIPGERITDESIRVILYYMKQGSGMVWSVSGNNDDKKRTDPDVMILIGTD